MRRQIVVALVTAVVAAALAAGATVLLTDDDDLALSSPPLVTPTPSARAEPDTSSPSATGGSTRPAPAPGRTGTPAPASTSSPSAGVRSATTVDCDTEENKCSQPSGMTVEDGKLHIVAVDDPAPDYSGVPKITMTSEFRKQDDTKASEGDEVHSLHVEVVVQNNTEKTFVFAKREIAFDIYKDGTLYDTLVTTGPGFNMTPGGKMTGTFDRPITSDGDYLWQAKTWYYEK